MIDASVSRMATRALRENEARFRVAGVRGHDLARMTTARLIETVIRVVGPERSAEYVRMLAD